METVKNNSRVYTKRLNELRSKVFSNKKKAKVNIKRATDWLHKKRAKNQSTIQILPISSLKDWIYSEKEGMVRHKAGTSHFFSVQGIRVQNANSSEGLWLGSANYSPGRRGLLGYLVSRN